jgi:hypothetical protein
VHDAPIVHVRQRFGQSRAELRGRRSTEWSTFQRFGERRTVDELHDEVGVVTGEPGVEQLNESGVFKTLESTSFLGQTSSELGIARAHDLQRDGIAAAIINRLVDVGHAPSTEQTDEVIPASKDVSDRSHRCAPR